VSNYVYRLCLAAALAGDSAGLQGVVPREGGHRERGFQILFLGQQFWQRLNAPPSRCLSEGFVLPTSSRIMDGGEYVTRILESLEIISICLKS
jgi:hypothetical protein